MNESPNALAYLRIWSQIHLAANIPRYSLSGRYVLHGGMGIVSCARNGLSIHREEGSQQQPQSQSDPKTAKRRQINLRDYRRTGQKKERVERNGIAAAEQTVEWSRVELTGERKLRESLIVNMPKSRQAHRSRRRQT